MIQPLRYIVAMVVVALFCLAGLQFFRHPADIVPPAVTKTADSLATTQPIFDSITTNAMAGVDRQVEVDQRLARRERALLATAGALKAHADSLALMAAASADSATAWRNAYQARTAEADTLRVAVDTLRARVDTLTAARDTARMVATLALDRVHVAEGTITDLRTAISKVRTDRSLLDYVAIGCGVGFKGPDCYIGARIPLGRPRK